MSEYIKEGSFTRFLSALPHLMKLKTIKLSLENCGELTNERMNELENIFEKLKNLTEFSFHLLGCENITNDGVILFLQSIHNSSHITKLDLSFVDNRYLNYKVFDPLSKVLTKLTNIEELSLSFESFCEISNPVAMSSLATGITSLPKLKKLYFSFADNVYLPAYIIRRFFSKITEHNLKITELIIDLSHCQDVMNTTLESIGLSLTKLTHLSTLVLKFKTCKVSEKGVRALLSHVCKMDTLRAFTLDCRYCKVDAAAQQRVIEQINKMTKLTESMILFGQDGANRKRNRKVSEDTDRSREFPLMWSPLESEISFEGEDVFDFEDYNGEMTGGGYEEAISEPEWHFEDGEGFNFGDGYDYDEVGEDDDEDEEADGEVYYDGNDFAILSVHSSDDNSSNSSD